MTERHAGYLVTLEEDIREDCDETIKAIEQIKGVIKVEPVPSDAKLQIAKNRTKLEIMRAIWKWLEDY